MPLYVPREVKYNLPFESMAGPSVLPQLLSEPSRSAWTVGGRGGGAGDSVFSGAGAEQPAINKVVNNDKHCGPDPR